jgi:hypothetical protein
VKQAFDVDTALRRMKEVSKRWLGVCASLENGCGRSK